MLSRFSDDLRVSGCLRFSDGLAALLLCLCAATAAAAPRVATSDWTVAEPRWGIRPSAWPTAACTTPG